MSLLLDIQKEMNVASQRVVLLERALAEHPEVPSIVGNLDSAVRIQRKLAEQFREAAAKTSVDIFKARARSQPVPMPKPASAWSLRFIGGSLNGVENRWHLTCPDDWANTVDGQTDRYVLKEADQRTKVATLELVTDAAVRA